MNQTWDLSVLYKDFDDPAYAADMAALDAAIAALHELAEEAGTLSASELTHRYADAGDAFVALESKLYIYASLRYSADTGNTAAASTVGRVMDKASAAVADDTRIREAIAAIGHDRLEELLSADPTLSEYAYLFRSILKDSRYRLSDREEALIAKMNLSGADAWENLQSSLTSSAKVLYRGQTITLSDVRNLAYDADPAVRRDAYDAEIACYEPIRDAVAFAMNSLKLQTINECALRGFSSPLDQALHASRMKRETLDALLSAMQEYLPVFWKYLRAKSAYLDTMAHCRGGICLPRSGRAMPCSRPNPHGTTCCRSFPDLTASCMTWWSALSTRHGLISSRVPGRSEVLLTAAFPPSGRAAC